MGIRGEIFSTKVGLQNRTYFFNVKENRLGDLYLNIVESKNRETGGFERQSVILFADDLQEFLKGFDESLKVLEKAVREKRKSEGPRGQARSGNRDESRSEGRQNEGRSPGRADNHAEGREEGKSPKSRFKAKSGDRPPRGEGRGRPGDGNEAPGGEGRSPVRRGKREGTGSRRQDGEDSAAGKKPRRVVVRKTSKE
jgi:hypothetical protein